MSLVNIIFTTLMTASIKDYSCCKFKLHVSKYTVEPHLRISTTLSRCNYLIIMATINGIQKDMQALLISMLKLIFSLSEFDLQCTSVTNDLLNLVFFRFLVFVNYHSWGTGKYFKELDIFLQGQHISHYFGSASISISWKQNFGKKNSIAWQVRYKIYLENLS